MAIVPNNSLYSQTNGQKKLWLVIGGLVVMTVIVAVAVGVLYFTREQTDEQQPSVDNAQPVPTVAVTPTVGLVVEVAPTQVQQVVLVITSPTPTVTPSPTEAPAVTATSSAAVVERIATATRAPTSTPTNTPRPFIPTATPTPAGVSVDGWIEPIAPDENFYLPADGLTFQWKWHENKGCQPPPDGYGFEIRVWRDVSTDFPKGAMNAKEEKVNITCDAASGIYSFTIGNVKKVPGVSNADFGRFKWDIAIVQLEPYAPVFASQPRIFYY
ncbi:MAG: hypothetical protein KDJ52_30835 [Anaerolineae bacterium]|nr:hypothetical protein [Anaerolineae bacterium]